MDIRKFKERTLLKFINRIEAEKRYIHFSQEEQKLWVGEESTHLTKSGRLYNKLIRLNRDKTNGTTV